MKTEQKKIKAKESESNEQSLFVLVSLFKHLPVQVCMVYVCALYICLCIFTFSFSHFITVYIEVPQEPGGLLINRHSIQSHVFVSLCVYVCALWCMCSKHHYCSDTGQNL